MSEKDINFEEAMKKLEEIAKALGPNTWYNQYAGYTVTFKDEK